MLELPALGVVFGLKGRLLSRKHGFLNDKEFRTHSGTKL